MKLLALVTLLSLAACSGEKVPGFIFEERAEYEASSDDFANYWYSGKAELASYELEQNRYGETRLGDAILIFVTEPFSEEKQVKLDNPESEDKVTVMKLNFTKKFQTGIYPYSMMSSIFTPIDDYNFPYSLKSTTSVQEWCGHTFTQINRGNGGFFVTGFSYFESEGDTEKFLEVALLEDDLWNRLRLNPDKLPVGKFDLIPGSFYDRFFHNSTEIYSADLTLEKGENESVYSIDYSEINRSLSIRFDNSFPYKILSWKEMENGELLSKGTLRQILHTDYWKKNSKEFEYLYDSLIQGQ